MAVTRATDKAQATRATLLDVAAETFEQDGYGATSVRDLADRSGMTTGAIYAHFRGKANLLAEAVKLRLERDLEEYGRRRYGHATLADWLARNFRDYRHRRAMRALLVEGAAAARVDEHARALLPRGAGGEAAASGPPATGRSGPPRTSTPRSTRPCSWSCSGRPSWASA